VALCIIHSSLLSYCRVCCMWPLPDRPASQYTLQHPRSPAHLPDTARQQGQHSHSTGLGFSDDPEAATPLKPQPWPCQPCQHLSSIDNPHRALHPRPQSAGAAGITSILAAADSRAAHPTMGSRACIRALTRHTPDCLDQPGSARVVRAWRYTTLCTALQLASAFSGLYNSSSTSAAVEAVAVRAVVQHQTQ